MQSLFFRILGAAITLLLLAALILVVVLTLRTEHEAIPTATPRPSATATDTPTTASLSLPGTDSDIPSAGSITATATVESVNLVLPDGLMRVEAGGFAYRSVPSFSTSQSDTSATLTGTSTNGDLAPIFLLSSGARDQFVDSSLETLDEAWHDPSRQPEDTIPLYTKPLQAENWDVALWHYSTAEKSDLQDRFEEFDLPILLITGDDDRLVPPENTIALQNLLTGSELVVIPDCGHVPQEECPGQFIEAVEDFLHRNTNSVGH